MELREKFIPYEEKSYNERCIIKNEILKEAVAHQFLDKVNEAMSASFCLGEPADGAIERVTDIVMTYKRILEDIEYDIEYYKKRFDEDQKQIEEAKNETV